MMTKSLADFLEELDSNAELKEAYLKAPVATAKSYGLEEADVTLIKNKDWDAVTKQFESSGNTVKVHSY
jgi:1,2-phenylacetyl-CoA epoxidase catalytic subunit